MNLLHALRLSSPSHTPAVVAFTGGGGKSSALFRLADEYVAAGQRVVTTTTTRISSGQVRNAPSHLLVPDGQIDWRQLRAALDSHSHCMLISGLGPPKASGIAPELVDELAHRGAELGLAAVLVEADGSAQRPAKAPASHEPVIPDAATLVVPVLGLDAIGLPLDDPHLHRPERVRDVLGAPESGIRLTPEMAARLLLHPQGGRKGRSRRARWLPLLNKADTPTRRLLGRLIAQRLTGQGESALLAAVGAGAENPVWERWGPTAAVVLAGGASTRMGAPKQLLELAGEALVVRAARLALESSAQQAVVVTGAYRREVEAALAALKAAAGPRLALIHNPAWETGQASSIRAAVAGLGDACQAALFFPVDQPGLPVALLRRFWRPWQQGSDRVATVINRQMGGQMGGQMRGAPALFDRAWFPRLLTLTGDQGARPLLAGDASGPSTVEAQAAWLADVDSPEEWQRFIGGSLVP